MQRRYRRKRFTVSGPIVGADIVEYNPSRDLNGVTAVLAAKLLKEVASLAAGPKL